jgi:hypothetical protein
MPKMPSYRVGILSLRDKVFLAHLPIKIKELFDTEPHGYTRKMLIRALRIAISTRLTDPVQTINRK